MTAPFRSALVVTGETNDDLALAACQLLAARGVGSTVAGLPMTGPLLRLSRSCRGVVQAAGSRQELEAGGEAVLDRLAAAARAARADLIFAADIPASLCAPKLKARLPGVAFFPLPDERALRRLDDKWAFYGLLREHGLPSPETRLIETVEQARGWEPPMILKPVALGGGRGVCVVRDAAEVGPLLAGGNRHLRLPVLAQRYVDGEDVDLSFLAVDGELNAWAVQTRRPDRTIDFIEDERVVELGRRLAKVCGYTGLAHVDMRYVDAARSAVTIIECNPRLWLSAPLTEGLGADFIGRGLELAAGRLPPAMTRAPAGECADVPGIGRKLLGRRTLTPCERAFLDLNLRDPAPVLYRRLRTSLGIRPGAA